MNSEHSNQRHENYLDLKRKRMFDSLIKNIKEGNYIDEDSDSIKWLKANMNINLKFLDPIFVEQKLVKQWKMNYRLYEIIMNQLNIIDTKFPYHCDKCGHQYATVTKYWQSEVKTIFEGKPPTHFARLDCSNCGKHFKWLSEEDFESRTTPPVSEPSEPFTRKLNKLGEFDDIDEALGI
tara:strand:- start:71 stop:607 length:537 start_codon:yes stop_codon:yes gene_type:complete